MAEPQSDLIAFMDAFLFLTGRLIERRQLIGPFFDIFVIFQLFQCFDEDRESLTFPLIQTVSENIAVKVSGSDTDKFLVVILGL